MNIYVDVITSRFVIDIIFHVDLRITFCKRIMPSMIWQNKKQKASMKEWKANK
jgi:hypothetical protein